MSCAANDTRTLVRFISNCLRVVKSGDTLFCSDNLCLNDFYESINDFNFETISLGATGSTTLIERECNLIFINTEWPTTAPESEKTLELQLSDFDYTLGGTGPLGATALSTEKIPFKDIFFINSVENHEHIKVTNPSQHDAKISIFTAKV